MIPVDQTIFGNRMGNCFCACLASIMELPIKIFPNYIGNGWITRCNQFLQNQFGLQLLLCSTAYDLFADDNKVMGIYHIMCGLSPTGCHHAVVGLNGKMIHDPGPPDRAGLEKVEFWGFLIKAGKFPFCRESLSMNHDYRDTKLPSPPIPKTKVIMVDVVKYEELKSEAEWTDEYHRKWIEAEDMIIEV